MPIIPNGKEQAARKKNDTVYGMALSRIGEREHCLFYPSKSRKLDAEKEGEKRPARERRARKKKRRRYPLKK